MKMTLILTSLAATGLAIAVGQLNATALPRGGNEGGVASGPDAIVGTIDGYAGWGGVTAGGETVMAYSFGSTECNVGTQIYAEEASTNQHAVIAQNLYRVKNGAIEQIGMSWVKHTFCALQGTLCGTCIPAGGGCQPALGVGCSSPTSSSSSGAQNQMGPRSQVNASTGAFPYPFSAPVAPATIGRRCQVNSDDLNPAMNAGASYFAEVMYIQPQDAAAGNKNNNASYRGVVVPGTMAGTGYNLVMSGASVQQKCAVHAWQSAVSGVTVSEVDTPDGRVVVGHRVTDNGNGTWHYEYAVFNMSSDASIGSVSVPVPAAVAVTNQGFHAVDYHSGEPYTNTDWAMSAAGGNATWSTESYASNSNANALRWGTLYNYRFDASAPATSGTVTLGLFKTPGNVTFTGAVPSAPSQVADLNHDGVVDGADLGSLLSSWGRCAGCAADFNGDGSVDGADMGALLGAWTE